MSRADPVSRAASVCSDDFQPVLHEAMADAMNRGKPERA